MQALVTAYADRLEHLETLGAPDMLLEHNRRVLYEARHGPLAGKNLAEASPDWLFRWARALTRNADVGKIWDLVHYALDPARRAREQAVHWRFREDPPTVFDYAMFGQSPSPMSAVTPPRNPEPDEAAANAEFWEQLFLHYDEFENDAALTAQIAEAIEAIPLDEAAAQLASPLPDHVYLGTLDDRVDAALDGMRALSRFYRRAADAGHHVRTCWVP